MKIGAVAALIDGFEAFLPLYLQVGPVATSLGEGTFDSRCSFVIDGADKVSGTSEPVGAIDATPCCFIVRVKHCSRKPSSLPSCVALSALPADSATSATLTAPRFLHNPAMLHGSAQTAK